MQFGVLHEVAYEVVDLGVHYDHKMVVEPEIEVEMRYNEVVDTFVVHSLDDNFEQIAE